MERNRLRFRQGELCPVLCITKTVLFLVIYAALLYLPLGDPKDECAPRGNRNQNNMAFYCLCNVFKAFKETAKDVADLADDLRCVVLDALYDIKMKFYSILSRMDKEDLCQSVCCSDDNQPSTAIEVVKEEIDRVIEDEITQKLSVDLLQSIERKFEVDLEKAVDMVLTKIKMLLQNGTSHVQDKMAELQGAVDFMKQNDEKEVERCLMEKQNETSALAEKALHQMVICGYALIGHDPAQAVKSVMALKAMIKRGIQPINEHTAEVYGLLKSCGHDHESLKKVIKCVISKSPLIKRSMMEVTGKLIEGIIDLTKILAHGAMHEACLIEVIKTVEEEAFVLLKTVKSCTYGNETLGEIENYIKQNNATVLDIVRQNDTKKNSTRNSDNKSMQEMSDLIRRMLSGDKEEEMDKKFKKKLIKLQKDLGAYNANDIAKNIIKVD